MHFLGIFLYNGFKVDVSLKKKKTLLIAVGEATHIANMRIAHHCSQYAHENELLCSHPINPVIISITITTVAVG